MFFVFGDNYYGQAGIDSQKYFINKFTEILTLRKYKITNVYANSFNSFFFQTENGQILACGSTDDKTFFLNTDTKKKNEHFYVPVETPIKSGAVFCSTGGIGSAVLMGFDAYMSPNRRVNENRIKILALGCKAKTKITQIFSSNNFESTSINKDDDDEYDIKVGLNNLVYYITIIDSSKSDNDYSMRMELLSKICQFFIFF